MRGRSTARIWAGGVSSKMIGLAAGLGLSAAAARTRLETKSAPTAIHATRSRLRRFAATGAGTPACEPPSAIHWSWQLHVVRGLDALVGILREARLDETLERGRRERRDLRDRHGLAAHDRGDERRLRFSGERALARRHLVEHAAERPDVGALVGLLPLELLGGHELERADDGALPR
jgi:hypothetical protein